MLLQDFVSNAIVKLLLNGFGKSFNLLFEVEISFVNSCQMGGLRLVANSICVQKKALTSKVRAENLI